jgi:tetratricopeptide (TPR) repeat protein/transcriptional regulator with XRE-family HTH domain
MEAVQCVAFGTLLRRYRIAAGLTQEELAERAGLSGRTIGDMERGVVHAPRKDTVALLAAALALDPQNRAAFAEAARRPDAPAPAVPISAGTSTPPFVGRAGELALLERHLAGEGPPVLLLAGEPGIGKTRLLHAAVPPALVQALRVLEGGCQRRGGHAPYAPLLDALQRHIRSRRPAQLRGDLRDCAWLVRLLPELADGPIAPLPAWTLSPEQERRLMVAAVVRFLGNVAGPAGTLLVLDDLQWASPDALDLLGTLAQSAGEVPLRVLGAYRDTEVQPHDPLSILLADLAHAGLAARRLLAPLDREDAAHLLDDLLADVAYADTARRERMLERAGGVPFYLVSCAQGLRQGVGDVAPDAVPWDVAQGIRQRVAALPAVTRDVLGVAAVVGRTVPPAVLVAASGQAEQEALAALDAACRARLLVEQGTDGYQFAHDVIREVIEADLGVARRVVLHRHIAETLERSPAAPSVEVLAYHYARSDAEDKALLYLEQAGDQALAAYANAAAEAYYRELVERLDRLGRALDGARAREKLGLALQIMLRYDAALAVLDQAAATCQRVGHLEGLARALAQIGRVHAERDTPEEGLARLQPLLERLGASASSRGGAALCAALAWLYLASGRRAQSVAAAKRAADLARAVGDEWILADVEVRRGRALCELGRVEQARRVVEAALPLVEAVGHAEALCRLFNNLGDIYKRRGEFDQSRRWREQALELAARIGDPTHTQWALAALGELLFLRGDWVAARAHLARAVAVTGSVAWNLISSFTFLALAQFHLAAGTWADATYCLEAGMSGGRRNRDLHLSIDVRRLLAERDLLEGRAEAARQRLVLLLDHDGVIENSDGIHLLALLARAHLELGEVGPAAAVARRAVTRARAEHDRLSLVDALGVQAMVATREEHWAEAACALEEGLSLARSMPYPYAEAHLLYAHAEMHAQRGERDAARERLEAALAIFQRLGARKDAERVEQTLAHSRRCERETA